MAVDDSTRDVVVARNDAIYYYGPQGRAPPYAYQGDKKMVRVFRDYVALVSPPKASTIRASSALRDFGMGPADDAFDTSTFTLLNAELRFVAHQESLPSHVKDVFTEWGDLFVLTVDGKVRPTLQPMTALYSPQAALPIPREALCSEAGHPLPAKSLRPGHQPRPEGRA